MFKIIDDYGTNRNAWTWREALAWLAVCSPQAQIVNRFTGRVIAQRVIAA